MHQAVQDILRYFDFEHLAPELQSVSAPFHKLAHEMAYHLEGPELTAGLRKLLEAKDCFVRAAITPTFRDKVHANFTGGN
jgi:hypothetical protein